MTLQQALELAAGLHRAGRLSEAEHVYRQVLNQEPNDPDALNLLGMAIQQRGDNARAVELIRKAIAVNPRVAAYHSNLGVALRDMGQLEAAAEAYRKAIELKPDDADAHNNLGNVSRDQGMGEQAIEEYLEAIRLMPEMAEAHYNLGITLASQGELDQAMGCYRRAMELKKDCPAIPGSLIYTMLYHPGHGMREVREELRKWREAFVGRAERIAFSHDNDLTPGRRLRVGYVSADFRSHACAHALAPLLRHHDRNRFEITLYAEVSSADSMTEAFRKLADRWRSTVGMSDEELAKKVREDRVDILVDLKVHTIGNRLLTFAKKPAPVQLTWLGYPGSTGLSEVDYRLTDVELDPIGRDETVYSEKLIRLPDCFWCYDPLSSGDIEPNPLPARGKGFVTFGSMNDFCKINDGVLELWARVLRAVPGSRLMILADVGRHRQRAAEYLKGSGVELSRVKFQTRRPRSRYLELYHRLDIALDPFPYNGATTTLDSLWMGVPVVSLVGDRAVGRAGASILTTLGAGEWLARSEEEYVKIAAGLATDLERLETIRGGLRKRMEASPLMNGGRFARGMEAVYREVWEKWRQSRGAR